MKENAKPEKPVPKPCICGRGGCVVVSRGKKMVSCPDPCNCPGNLRTRWHSHEESAIVEWNNLVAGYRRTST